MRAAFLFLLLALGACATAPPTTTTAVDKDWDNGVALQSALKHEATLTPEQRLAFVRKNKVAFSEGRFVVWGQVRENAWVAMHMENLGASEASAMVLESAEGSGSFWNMSHAGIAGAAIGCVLVGTGIVVGYYSTHDVWAQLGLILVAPAALTVGALSGGFLGQMGDKAFNQYSGGGQRHQGDEKRQAATERFNQFLEQRFLQQPQAR